MKKILLLLSCFTGLFLQAQNPDWQWAKAAGGTNADIGNGVCTDSNGDIYVTGNYTSPSMSFGITGITNAGTNTNDIFLAKYTPSGDLVWVKSFGGAGHDYGYALATDINNNIFMVGQFTSASISFDGFTLTTAAPRSMYIVKFDSDGNALWCNSCEGAGGLANTVTTGPDGGVYVGGNFSESAIGFGAITLTHTGPNGTNLYLVKYDASGNILWAKNAGGTLLNNAAHCSDIETDSDNNVFITGYFLAPQISFGSLIVPNHTPAKAEIFLAKYNAAGNEIWAINAGGDFDDIAEGMAIDNGGNIWITGWFQTETSFGSIGLAAAGNYDAYLAKYDSSGNALWANRFGGAMSDYGTGLCVGNNGNINLAGSFRSSSIDIGTNTFTNHGTGLLDLYVANFDTSGNLQWARAAGSTRDDAFYSVAAGTGDSLYFTGFFISDSCVFDTAVLENVSATAVADMMLAKIAPPLVTVPLFFTYIHAVKAAHGNLVEWQVENGFNMLSYTVQRSKDAAVFTDIETVPAKDNPPGTDTYNWLDPYTSTGNIFYRIRSMDRNNNILYSKIVNLAGTTNEPVVKIFPNPVSNGQIKLQASNLEKGLYTIRIINKSGQTLLNQRMYYTGDGAFQPVSLNTAINRGVYSLHLFASKQLIKSLEFIIEL
jgi:hypothetical protein